MIEEIFSTDELVDNLRIIHNHNSKKETYELIKLSNADGDIITLPFSRRTMYDLYTLIDKYLQSTFNNTLNNDLLKNRKYEEFKMHDTTIDKISEVDIETEKDIFDKTRDWLLDSFTFNREIIEEFEINKIKSLIIDTIDEETGMLDNYYIGKYISTYEDTSIDFDKILIDSINEYSNNVSKQTKAHYPIINDYGTAQEYFYKVSSRTMDSYIEGSDKTIGRLYYRYLLNNDMKKYIEEECSRITRRSALIHTILLFTEIIGSFILVPHITNGMIIFLLLINLIGICSKIRASKLITKKCDYLINYENKVLALLSALEHKNISNWYKINK